MKPVLHAEIKLISKFIEMGINEHGKQLDA